MSLADIQSMKALKAVNKLIKKTSIPKTISNQIVNGDFTQNSTWSPLTANMTIDTTNGQGAFTATATLGQIYQNVALTNGHKYYYCVNFNSSSNNVKFDIYDGTNQYALTSHPGNSQFSKASGIFTALASYTNTKFRVVDYRSSGWSSVSVKNCVLVDLTNMYGTGNEPNATSDFEALLQSRYGSLFINGTNTLYLDNTTPRYMPNLIINGNFKLNNTWASNLSNITIDIVNGEGDCTATAKFGQIYQIITLTSGHKYYYNANILANSNSISFDLYDGTNQYGLTYHPTGNGQYANASGIFTAISTSSNVKVRAMDARTSGWDMFKLKNVIVIDLTASYGAGNEPIQSDFEALLNSQLGGIYYDGNPVINLPQSQAKSISNKNKQLAMINGTNCKIQFQYTPTQTMWLVLDECGPNNLFNWYQWYTTNASRVDGNFTNASLIMQAATDFIGPMVIGATANINGDNVNSYYFTGGFHETNNLSSGGMPTARQVSLMFYVDGVQVSSWNDYAEEVRIVSVSRLQAFNTSLSTGGGREVLEQTVTFVFRQGLCELMIKLNPLESVSISTYYGIQTSNAGIWNSTVNYLNGNGVGRQPYNTNNNSGALSSYPNVDRFSVMGPNGDVMMAWIDNSFGLGTRSYVASSNPSAFTESYAKSYFNLINGITCSLNAGQVVYVHGGYVFVQKATIDTNLDLASRILRNGKIYNVYDFLSADSFVATPYPDEWFKTSNTLDELQKSGTITGISNNTWDSYKVTSTGAGSYMFRFTNN